MIQPLELGFYFQARVQRVSTSKNIDELKLDIYTNPLFVDIYS